MSLLYSEEFGKAFIPKKFRPHIRKYLLKAGIDRVPYSFYGFLFYLSVAITAYIYIVYVYPVIGGENSSRIVFVISTFLSWSAINLLTAITLMFFLYAYYDYKIFKRTKQIEDVLQDFLRYVSENLRGGMPLDKALWDAIRPKFGVLANEVRLTAKKVMTGEDIEVALKEFTDKYNSPMVKRSFNLVIEGLKGGGDIAKIIDRVEKNLRDTKNLKQEISATNTTYVIFIAIVTLVVAPALFALSFNLLVILKNLTKKLGAARATGGARMPFKIGEISINLDDFRRFSEYALGITAAFAASIVSMIRYGNIKEGVKYIPVYTIISILLYLLFLKVLVGFFGGLVT